MHRDVSFHVHRALMQSVYFRNPRRQWFEMQPLLHEQFARHGADMFLVRRVDAVAPLEANLDEGTVWPVAFALKELTATDEVRIGALVKKAVS